LLTQADAGVGCGPKDAREFLALCAAVRNNLPPNRYRHVLGVARTAERLARRYGLHAGKARVAAMIHDIARNWSPQKLLEYARAHDLEVSDQELHAPVLLHAKVAASVAREQFGVSDPEVLAAIRHHTVAVPDMGELEKVLYIADAIEPSRTFFGRAALEAAAYRSLDEGMVACLAASFAYLQSNGITIPPASLALHRQLVSRLETHA
jgi:predicted HD superfamily hydrolase involved in NAD metabolism